MDQRHYFPDWTDRTSFCDEMIEKAAEGICVCHVIDEFPFVRFSIWNARMTEITGYTLKEINRDGWYQSVYPDPVLQQKAIERMQLMRDGSDLFNEQWELTRKDGQKIRVRISTSRLEADDEPTQVVAFMQDITEQIQAAAMAEWQAGVNKVLAEVAEVMISSKTIDDIAYIILDHARRLTASQFGYVGYIDSETDHLICPTIARDVWEKCEVFDKNIVFKNYHGLLGWVLQNKLPLMTNDPQKDPRYAGIPSGHVPIKRLLAVPAKYNDRLMGQIALANASRDYTQHDVELIERLAVFFALAVQRQHSENVLIAKNLELEGSVNTQAAEIGGANRRLRQEIATHRSAESALLKSEAVYRTLVESSDDAIYQIGSDGRYQFINAAGARALGQERTEIIGRSLSDVFPADTAATLLNFLKTICADKQILRLEHPLMIAGRQREYSTSLVPVIGLDGEVDSVIGIGRDVSGYIQDLQRSEEKFRALVSSSRDHIFMLDCRGHYLFSNESCDQLGVESPEELLHRSLEDIYPPEIAHYYRGQFNNVLFTQRPVDFEHALYSSGRKIFHHDTLYPIFKDGQIIAVGGICRDITAAKQSEQALRQSEEKLRAMLLALGDNISMVDRDLRIIWANESAKGTFGPDMEGRKCHEVYHAAHKPCEPSNCVAQLAFKDGKVYERQAESIDKNGRKRIFHCTASVALRDGSGIPESVIIISRDITDQQMAIIDLQQKEIMLKKQAKSLEDVNTALDVLLQHRAKELAKFQKNVISNLNLGVFPHLERLKSMVKQEKQKSYLKMIEFNLSELIAPFSGRPAPELINLTPTELEISQLIKQGMTSKEIANTMNLSLSAIAFHRSNIRKKLGLMNRKADLRSHLQSLQ